MSERSEHGNAPYVPVEDLLEGKNAIALDRWTPRQILNEWAFSECRRHQPRLSLDRYASGPPDLRVWLWAETVLDRAEKETGTPVRSVATQVVAHGIDPADVVVGTTVLERRLWARNERGAADIWKGLLERIEEAKKGVVL